MDMTDEHRLWATRGDVRLGLEPVVGRHVVVGDDDADPRVARIVSVDSLGFGGGETNARGGVTSRCREGDRAGARVTTSAYGQVIDLEHVRVSRLAAEVADQIRSGQGSVVRMAADVGDVERWRRAVRCAGRLLGVPVRTGVAPDGERVWAVDNS